MELLDESLVENSDSQLKEYNRAKNLMKFFLLIYVFIFWFFWNRMKYYFQLKKFLAEDGAFFDMTTIPMDLRNGLIIFSFGFFGLILFCYSIYKYKDYISVDRNWLLFVQPIIALIIHYLLLEFSSRLIWNYYLLCRF